MKKLLLPVLLCITVSAFCQKQKSLFSKFGRITKDMLSKSVYVIDSNANAIVLSRIGETRLTMTQKGFSLNTKIHTVTHILNEKGYDEANGEISLFVTKGADEGVYSFKGVTYNLENDKITETKIGKSELIKTKLDDNRILMKFTMPNVRKGSVIEYAYEVNSDFISMPDAWYFQSTTAPTLWSEYLFAIPQFLYYHISSRGYIPLDIVESDKRSENFGMLGIVDVDYKRWVAKDVPELKTEPYTKSVKNHLSRLDFQLNSFQYPLEFKSFRNTWQEIAKDLLESEYFGRNLNTNNNWLKDEVKNIVGNESDPMKKAQKLYAFIRDDFKTIGSYGIYMRENLKSIFKSKQGTVCELNLLLTAMLRYVDLDAEPVLLSTTANGYAMEFLPLITSMNYVVSKVKIGGKDYLLDASERRMGFGKLPEYCYNGYSMVVNKEATALDLSSDSLKERRTVLNFFSNSEGGYNGMATHIEGYYKSFNIRNDIQSKGEEQYFRDIKKRYSENVIASSFKIDSLNRYDDPLKVSYHLKLNINDENVLYVNPYFGENYSKNPFASLKRNYPVEFPFVQEEIIVTTMEIPKGYAVDELPKSMRVKLDDQGDTYFEYRISKDEKMVAFTSKLKIGKTFFLPNEYENLRQFFTLVVDKQAEQIVFKKTTP